MGTGAGPRDGTVDVGPAASGAMLVVVVGTGGDADSNSSTTSSWARTGAGRSVTSAATVDVAIQTMPVDAAVTASHRPVANKRDSGTTPECPAPTRPRAKGALNRTSFRQRCSGSGAHVTTTKICVRLCPGLAIAPAR